MIITPVKNLKGEIVTPGDKSISHRGIILGSIAQGKTVINGFLMGDDCLSTIRCFRQLGIHIQVSEGHVVVEGKGLKGLTPSMDALDVGNSGTTFRLMSGLLAAQNFTSTLTGDASIQSRPMLRVVKPLRLMEADITGKNDGNFAPLSIKGRPLKGIRYNSPIASAQVKSCLLLASLYATEKTTITEPIKSRDHTERMLHHFGHSATIDGLTVTSEPSNGLFGQPIRVPGDISSAAYFLVAGLILPNSEILIKNVGINPTRNGILNVLKEMGANISYINEHIDNEEPVADLLVSSSRLKGTTVGGEIIPTLIDEIPIIAVAACFAEGKTIIKDAEELKVKESNRIQTMVAELTKMGARIEETDDGMVIEGTGLLKGALVESYHDHRIAMSLAIAGLNAKGETTINNSDCIKISYPSFYEDLQKLI